MWPRASTSSPTSHRQLQALRPICAPLQCRSLAVHPGVSMRTMQALAANPTDPSWRPPALGEVHLRARRWRWMRLRHRCGSAVRRRMRRWRGLVWRGGLGSGLEIAACSCYYFNSFLRTYSLGYRLIYASSIRDMPRSNVTTKKCSPTNTRPSPTTRLSRRRPHFQVRSEKARIAPRPTRCRRPPSRRRQCRLHTIAS